MLLNSLGLSDVIELAVLCAIIFIPIGFFLCWYYEHINYVFKSKSFLKNNLRDSGSFSSFLKKTK